MGKLSGVEYPDVDANPGMIRYRPTWAFRSLLEIRATVIPMVFMAPDTYIHLLGHIIWLVYQLLNRNDEGVWITANWEPPSLPWSAVTMPASLLAFFIVFFTGNTYSRFNALYEQCMSIHARILEIAGLCEIHVRDARVRWDVVRLVLASMVVHYHTMHGGHIDENEWANLEQFRLLTPEETHLIRTFQGPKFWRLQCMALKLLKAQMCKESGNDVQAREYRHMEELFLEARRACGAMANAIANPIPFPYYHILLLLIWFTYSLISYSMSFFFTPLTLGAFLLVIIVITGMREAAAAMADPFGSDVFDFPMQIFAAETIRASKAILADASPSAQKCLIPPVVSETYDSSENDTRTETPPEDHPVSWDRVKNEGF